MFLRKIAVSQTRSVILGSNAQLSENRVLSIYMTPNWIDLKTFRNFQPGLPVSLPLASGQPLICPFLELHLSIIFSIYKQVKEYLQKMMDVRFLVLMIFYFVWGNTTFFTLHLRKYIVSIYKETSGLHIRQQFKTWVLLSWVVSHPQEDMSLSTANPIP